MGITKRRLKNLLVRARAKISRKGSWIKHQLARDSRGRVVLNVRSSTACRFCLSGAIGAAARDWDDDYRAREFVAGVLLLEGGRLSITAFNDDPRRTHKQVLALLDKAIDSAEQLTADYYGRYA